LQHNVPSIFAGHCDPPFRLELALKDLDVIQKLIADYGTRFKLTQACHDRLQEAADRCGARAGEMSVCRFIEDDAGVSMRVEGDWVAPLEATPSATQSEQYRPPTKQWRRQS